MNETLPAIEEAPIVLNPKQQKFVLSAAEFSAYGGGVGNGKTLAGIIKTWQHCEKFPGAYFLIGRRHSTDLRKSVVQDFVEKMRGYGHYSPGYNEFTFPNGSKIIFSHLDDLQSLTNINLSGFWVDQAEEIPEEAFDYLIGRCRRQRSLTGIPITERPKFITYNPNGHDWIWRLFLEKLDSDGKPLAEPQQYHAEVATTYENRANLPDDYIKALEQRPEEWKKRFLYGSHDTKAGRIFDEYNPAIHIIPQGMEFAIPLTWERFRSIDHGQNNPTACLWCAVDFDGNIYVYQEYYKPSAAVSYHTERIKALSKIMTQNGLVPDTDYRYTIIDPSTHAKTREKDGFLFSVADEYMDAGLPTMKAQNSVEAGINRTKEYLRVDPERLHPFLKVSDLYEGHPLMKYNLGRPADEPVKGAPRLFIFHSCENLRRELPEYQWQPLKYNQIGMQNANEKPVKNFDHAVDALRYAIMSRPIAPQHLTQVDPRVWQDPLLLEIYAKRLGKTGQDLIAERFRHDGHIRTTEGGIKKRSSL